MEQFIQFPELPGVLISGIGGDRLLSRQQLLECLLYTGQVSPDESLQRLLHLADREALTLSIETPILNAAKQALRRSLDQQNVPIIVQSTDNTQQLLDPRILNLAYWQIRGIETQLRYERLQMQLLQSEKMAALGRLVDGVAHEILDPVGFIWGNLSYIASYAQQQSELLAAYETALPNPPQHISQLASDIELDYLRSDLPAAIQSARGGAHRLKQLATSLQNFCHIDEVHPRPADINTLLDSTLHLLQSRITTPIQVERDYGKLPPIPCYAGQLNQVFITLLTTAIDSLLTQSHQTDCAPQCLFSASRSAKLEIVTRTCTEVEHLPESYNNQTDSQLHETRWVSIEIRDNGPGLSPACKAQILDSFSTQNRSRKESGLSLSYQIVTARHGGKFLLRSRQASEPENPLEPASPGTEFKILLPLTESSLHKTSVQTHSAVIQRTSHK